MDNPTSHSCSWMEKMDTDRSKKRLEQIRLELASRLHKEIDASIFALLQSLGLVNDYELLDERKSIQRGAWKDLLTNYRDIHRFRGESVQKTDLTYETRRSG